MIVDGIAYRFAGELVLDAPHEIADGCTRKKLTLREEGSIVAMSSIAVQLRDGRVVIVLPAATNAAAGRYVRIEVTLARDARPIAPPPDLLQALRESGLTLDELPEHEVRHLVSLVREAKDHRVREERITNVIDRLRTSSS